MTVSSKERDWLDNDITSQDVTEIRIAITAIGQVFYLLKIDTKLGVIALSNLILAVIYNRNRTKSKEEYDQEFKKYADWLIDVSNVMYNHNKQRDSSDPMKNFISKLENILGVKAVVLPIDGVMEFPDMLAGKKTDEPGPTKH